MVEKIQNVLIFSWILLACGLKSSLAFCGAVLLTQIDTTSSIDAAAISPDNRNVATANEDGVVRIWETAGGTLSREIGNPAFFFDTRSVIFFSDNQRVLIADASQGITIWNSNSGEQLFHYTDETIGQSPAFLIQNEKEALWVSDSSDAGERVAVHYLNLETKQTRSIELDPPFDVELPLIETADLSGDETMLALGFLTRPGQEGERGGVIAICDLAKGKVAHWIDIEYTPSDYVDISEDGLLVLAGGCGKIDGGYMRLWETIGGQVVQNYGFRRRTSCRYAAVLQEEKETIIYTDVVINEDGTKKTVVVIADWMTNEPYEILQNIYGTKMFLSSDRSHLITLQLPPNMRKRDSRLYVYRLTGSSGISHWWNCR